MNNNAACVQALRQPYHSYRYPFQGLYLIKAKTTVCSKPEKHMFENNISYAILNRICHEVITANETENGNLIVIIKNTKGT